MILQKSCIDFAINATPLERYMPEERVGVRYRLWRIVESTPFEYFIMTLIVFNTILLMMKVHHGSLLRNPFVREKTYPKCQPLLLMTLTIRGH